MKSPRLLWWTPRLPHPHLPFIPWRADAAAGEFMQHVPHNILPSYLFLNYYYYSNFLNLKKKFLFFKNYSLIFEICQASWVYQHFLPLSSYSERFATWSWDVISWIHHRDTSRTVTGFSAGTHKLALPVLWARQELCKAPDSSALPCMGMAALEATQSWRWMLTRPH